MNRFATVLGLIIGLVGQVRGGSITYSLANDWSDTSNPNGVWSYNQAPGVPISVHQSDYFPGATIPQPAWAYEQIQFVGHIPVWMKATND
jgi:hypothetical protein